MVWMERLRSRRHEEEALGGGGVAFEGDDCAPECGGEGAELAGVGADVEDARGLEVVEDRADPVDLLWRSLRRCSG